MRITMNLAIDVAVPIERLCFCVPRALGCGLPRAQRRCAWHSHSVMEPLRGWILLSGHIGLATYQFDRVHRGKDHGPLSTIRVVSDSPPSVTAKPAANTGSRVITMAARVAGR